MAEPHNTDDIPLRQKMESGANYGMLAGFWAELPVLTVFAFRNPQAYWSGLREWSARLVLPATLAGLLYGWTKPARDMAAHPHSKTQQIPQTQESVTEGAGLKKSWEEREAARIGAPGDLQR